jgi:hypothetical protein
MTIGSLLILAGVVMAGGLIMELCAVFKAPLGYQDEQGFHAGVKNRSDKDF